MQNEKMLRSPRYLQFAQNSLRDFQPSLQFGLTSRRIPYILFLNYRRPMQANLKSETVKFTTKGQVVIPARLRRALQISEGTKATVTATADGILLRPINRAYIQKLRGSLKGRGVMKSMMAERKRERAI